MKVKELIERLKECDQEAPVKMFNKHSLEDDSLEWVAEITDNEAEHILYVALFNAEGVVMLKSAS